mgnify:CR=1 FL=1
MLNGIADASDAEAQLHRLSSQLSSRPPDAAAAMELAVLEAPELDDLESVLGYLNDIQPVWSEFLEAHTTVGSRHGKLNAHGNPLSHHVLGICHSLSLGTAELAEAVDTYAPTRLSLTASNLGLSAQTPGGAPASAAASAGASQPDRRLGVAGHLDLKGQERSFDPGLGVRNTDHTVDEGDRAFPTEFGSQILARDRLVHGFEQRIASLRCRIPSESEVRGLSEGSAVRQPEHEYPEQED